MAQLRSALAGCKTEVDNHVCGLISFLTVAEETKAKCQICQKLKPPQSGTFGEALRPSLLSFIQKRVPSFASTDFICFEDLGTFRRDYVKEVLEDEIGELSTLDHEVVNSLQQHEILSENIGKEFEKELTFGERLSDRIADFGGSWTFISSFGAILFVWILINTAHPGETGLRSLSLYPHEPDSLLPGSDSRLRSS